MGRRGRQRAKESRIAQELKYREQPTDFAALERELTSPDGGRLAAPEPDTDEPDSAEVFSNDRW